MISIVDYGAGNIGSVKKALEFVGADAGIDAVIARCAEDIRIADAVIFPGVGSFGFVMERIRDNGMDCAIKDAIYDGKPYLGICLGLQVLFEKSEESPGASGLGIFKGDVRRFIQGKVPQIGWNNIDPVKCGSETENTDNNNIPSIFRRGYAYFVNSYYVKPDDDEIVSTWTDYSVRFASSVRWKNVTATQFHPEKSGAYGLEIIRRWLECLRKE